jgi:hypothetical protein
MGGAVVDDHGLGEAAVHILDVGSWASDLELSIRPDGGRLDDPGNGTITRNVGNMGPFWTRSEKR